ncbi:MAG: hypothetical protein ABRQ39_28480 [Candidatus Eremiobacterota bacterium]
MVIQTSITDGKNEIEAVVETEPDCISISFPGSSASINIIASSNGKITAYVYSNANDTEIIPLITL